MNALAVEHHPPTAKPRGHIRPLAMEDMPQVLDLHQKVLRGGRIFSPDTAESYRSYFHEIFFRHPWTDQESRSLAYQADDGKVIGCLGVLPCLMSWRGQTIRAALGHHFMVQPDSRSTLAALELLKAFLMGPHELALATEANNTSRRIWEVVGGKTSLLYSLRWTRALRPSRFVLSRLETRRSIAPLVFAFKPLCSMMDVFLARAPGSQFRLSCPALTAEELTAEALLDCLRALSRHRSLGLIYERPTLDWHLSLLDRIKTPGDLQKALLRDSGGRVAGWYLYYLNPGGVSEVVQAAATGNAMEAVLDHLFYHAWNGGSFAVSGQVDPRFMQEYLTSHCFLHGGSWTLVHTRDPDLLQAIDRGDALLTRLEGEWTIGF
ncbi:MAG: hypothetical protein ACREQP_18930 [Candidatus Binatia bacterium]